MQQPDDDYTWQQFVAGDKKAFSVLFLKYHPLLLHYGIKLCCDVSLAEECVQDLFCYLLEHKHKLSGVHQVKSYLFVSYRRRIFRVLENKRTIFLDDATPFQAGIQFSQEEILIDQEKQQSEKQQLWKMLNELPARQREVIYLKYYQGLDTNEIAGAMHISHQGVLNALYKAFKKLRSAGSKNLKSSFYYLFLF